jgi:hypothetical protein
MPEDTPDPAASVPLFRRTRPPLPMSDLTTVAVSDGLMAIWLLTHVTPGFPPPFSHHVLLQGCLGPQGHGLGGLKEAAACAGRLAPVRSAANAQAEPISGQACSLPYGGKCGLCVR